MWRYLRDPNRFDTVKLLISAYFTGELTQRDPQEVREEGP